MSIVVERYIHCDGCGYNAADVDRHATGTEQRKGLKADGWRQIGDKDYCQQCARAAQSQEGAA